MSSGEAVRDYDYLITDSNGTRKVKNGVEYPAGEDDLPKEHKNSGCTECTFVSDKETILVFKVDRQLKKTVNHIPIFVGNFTMPQWVGHSGFYLFKCKECRVVCSDSPHGYTDGGYMYLCCDNCRRQLVITESDAWGREIYVKENLAMPPTRTRVTFFQSLCKVFLKR